MNDAIRAARIGFMGTIIAALFPTLALVLAPLVKPAHDPCPARNAAIAQALDQHPALAQILDEEDDGYDRSCGASRAVVGAERLDPPTGTSLARQQLKPLTPVPVPPK